jgi:hypothetical protein
MTRRTAERQRSIPLFLLSVSAALILAPVHLSTDGRDVAGVWGDRLPPVVRKGGGTRERLVADRWYSLRVYGGG